MDEIKRKCYDILLEIDRICRLDNIKYYIYAGTLLGAVRHGGFIPWDDDIDVVMMREDYKKFELACKKHLNREKFLLQTIDTDPVAGNPWMKLHDCNTAFISGIRRDNAMEGISIDIFPVDNVPDNILIRKARARIIDRLNLVYHWRFSYYSKDSALKMKLVRVLSNMIPPWGETQFKKWYDKYIQKYNKHITQDVVYLSSRKYTRKVISRHVFDSTEMMRFEGGDFPAPGGWKEVLEGLYGKEYMKLPPKEQQVTVHGTAIIDLEHSWREYRRGPNGYEKV